jgi:hypothetical protein
VTAPRVSDRPGSFKKSVGVNCPISQCFLSLERSFERLAETRVFAEAKGPPPTSRPRHKRTFAAAACFSFAAVASFSCDAMAHRVSDRPVWLVPPTTPAATLSPAATPNGARQPGRGRGRMTTTRVAARAPTRRRTRSHRGRTSPPPRDRIEGWWLRHAPPKRAGGWHRRAHASRPSRRAAQRSSSAPRVPSRPRDRWGLRGVPARRDAGAALGRRATKLKRGEETVTRRCVGGASSAIFALHAVFPGHVRTCITQ